MMEAKNETVRLCRKTFVGSVEKRFGEKGVKVIFLYKKPHPLFHKEIKHKTVLYAHDEKSICDVGDEVEVMSTRPLSRLKRWRVVRLLKKASNKD
jgi:small subunit ribosomal protein S17